MKKQMLTLVLLAFIFSINAQPPKPKHKPNFTTEQKVELAVKKMTLALDLNAKQQNDLKPIITKQIENREAAMKKMKAMRDEEKKPTSDELYAMANQKLDAQIAFKNSMKSILTDEQFAKFEKMHHAKKREMKEGFKKRRPENKK